jgi:DNA-binding transcriptional ArsR family regulator
MQVGTLAEKVDLSQSALSQHLAKLRNATAGEDPPRRHRRFITPSIRIPVMQMLQTLTPDLLQLTSSSLIRDWCAVRCGRRLTIPHACAPYEASERINPS